MGLSWGTVLFAISVGSALARVDDHCPPKENLSPCMCDGEGINCLKAKDDATLKQALARMGGGTYRGFWLQGGRLTQLPRNMFHTYRIGRFFIEANQITVVESGAFAGSEDVCVGISVFRNNLTHFPYDDLPAFKYLQNINIGGNRLTHIPAGAFSKNPRLTNIILAENQISSIGSDAFSNLMHLQKIDLTKNKLTILGSRVLSINVHAPNLQLFLPNNQISTVSPEAFDKNLSPAILRLDGNQLTSLAPTAFAPLISNMLRKGGFIMVNNNPFSCVGCDYAWVVQNRQLLMQFLSGFQCLDGKTLNQLTFVNIRCIVP